MRFHLRFQLCILMIGFRFDVAATSAASVAAAAEAAAEAKAKATAATAANATALHLLDPHSTKPHARPIAVSIFQLRQIKS